MANAKGSTQAGGNMKSHLAKSAANILGSPNAKTWKLVHYDETKKQEDLV